jgi:hypothetical protein
MACVTVAPEPPAFQAWYRMTAISPWPFSLFGKYAVSGAFCRASEMSFLGW